MKVIQFCTKFYLIFQQYVPFFSGCFRQSVVGRRLASKYISKSWTAYTLEECKQFCANETSLYCSGFAYRKVTNQREILNCDLSEKNTSQLDAYNNEHFIVNAVTDFYDRFNAVDTSTETGENNCKNSLNHSNNQKIGNTGKLGHDSLENDPNRRFDTGFLLQPQRGNDQASIIESELLLTGKTNLTGKFLTYVL